MAVYLDRCTMFSTDSLSSSRFRIESFAYSAAAYLALLLSTGGIGPSIYDVQTEGEGVRLTWTHVDRGRVVKPHVDVHTEN